MPKPFTSIAKSMGNTARSEPGWMKLALLFAAAYNLVWMVVLLASPGLPFRMLGVQEPNYSELVRLVGLAVGLSGLGYAIAAYNPMRHWPVVALGFLAKLLGPVVAAVAISKGRLPASAGLGILFNDLIWLLPFAAILYRAYDEAIGEMRIVSPEVQKMALRSKTTMGISLDELSRMSPILLVFLRHAGCPFCRETLADLARNRRRIEEMGARIVLVHMGADDQVQAALNRFGLPDIDRVSDPRQAVYRAFGLGRGRLAAILGPRVWFRVFVGGLLARYGIGEFKDDIFQMPGAFLIFHGAILRSYVHRSSADRPDYVALVAADPVAQSAR